ncbi:MAG: P1 family peptidase [Acidimicrobiales bacterium]
MITDIDGVLVGHWTDVEGRTGCTVVRFPEGTVASAEVRGGAPASRELDLLAPHRTVNRLDAVVLSGGSAFGLAAADGVMSELEAEGVGFATAFGVVPIVVGLSLFDLGVGDPAARPGPAEGRTACRAAATGRHEVGLVGAGTGATVGKWRGREHARPGGIGVATVRDGDVVVAALLAVNATGDIDDGTMTSGPVDLGALRRTEEAFHDEGLADTTIGVIATNARLDKNGCLVVAQGGHDGMARALFPPHTSADGDALVAAAIGRVDADLDLVRALAVVAVEQAIRGLGGALAHR